MESKKINQLATELAPDLTDLTIIGDPITGISKKITLSQMASLFTGTVEEYANKAAFPLVGVADTIYVALDTNVIWRWNTGTSAYVELSPNIINSLVFGDGSGFDGTISLVGSVATLTITTALTTGSVGFIGASGALLQDNANFFWDDTNNRLGIGTNAPTTAIDVFGSGIIGRLNGTSTNNAFLGFASAGSNKWSIGNVQSDHRFRIYNEATTSELVSVLSTGEFGIGIANPTTKFHIDGAASALIANLDANVSVAKSISFRSDNNNRINLEVSGTESGSNAGANFFLRTYTDAGALIETPLSIVRSTGVTTLKSLTLTNALSVANGGTGSTTQNFVDLTTIQSIGGAKTFTSVVTGKSFSVVGTNGYSGQIIQQGDIFGSAATNLLIQSSTGNGIGFLSNGGTTFNMFINSTGLIGANTTSLVADTNVPLQINATASGQAYFGANNNGNYGLLVGYDNANGGYGRIRVITNTFLAFDTNNSERLRISNNGFLKSKGSATNYVSLANSSHEISTSTDSNYTLFLSSQATTPYGLYIWYANASPNNSTNEFLACTDTTNTKAYIYSNGNLANRNGTYGTISSDIRLKENIATATSKLNDLLKLNVVNFNFKDDTDKKKQLGFIAQEFKEIFPSLVYQRDTRKYDEQGNLISGLEDSLGVQVGMEFAILTKAIQELNDKVESIR